MFSVMSNTRHMLDKTRECCKLVFIPTGKIAFAISLHKFVP